MGRINIDNEGSYMHIIAGTYNSVAGPAKTFSPVHLYDVRLIKDACIDLNFEKSYNTAILLVEGSLIINDKDTAPCNHFVLFANDGTNMKIKALENATILVMSGEPINEEVYPYGPFLMNTEEEIEIAYADYQNGFFGFLED